MLQRILRVLDEHSYPRRGWADSLGDLLRPLLRPGQVVVDAPCGGGVISLWLSRAFPECRFELLDISEPAIAAARRRMRGRLADTRCGDVATLGSDPSDDVWLLVNSWFLLEDPARLLREKRPRFRHVVVLCDDVSSENYRAFCRSHPGFDGGHNRNAKPFEEVSAIVEDCGYRLLRSRRLSFLPLYAWGDSLLATTLFTWLDGLARRCGGEPGYWVGLFERRVDSAPPGPAS